MDCGFVAEFEELVVLDGDVRPRDPRGFRENVRGASEVAPKREVDFEGVGSDSVDRFRREDDLDGLEGVLVGVSGTAEAFCTTKVLEGVEILISRLDGPPSESDRPQMLEKLKDSNVVS